MKDFNSLTSSTYSDKLGDEARLARELRLGDPAALEALYKLYGSQVYRLVFRIVRDHGASEDITQDSFARLWHCAQRLAGDSPQIGPLILTIARRCALDYLRSRGVQARLCENLGFEHPELNLYPSPDDILLDKENMRMVVGALARLGANQKRVIEMAYYRGLTQSQIACELNQPLGTVKSWARSALSALRSDVEQTGGLAKTA